MNGAALMQLNQICLAHSWQAFAVMGEKLPAACIAKLPWGAVSRFLGLIEHAFNNSAATTVTTSNACRYNSIRSDTRFRPELGFNCYCQSSRLADIRYSRIIESLFGNSDQSTHAPQWRTEENSNVSTSLHQCVLFWLKTLVYSINKKKEERPEAS